MGNSVSHMLRRRAPQKRGSATASVAASVTAAVVEDIFQDDDNELNDPDLKSFDDCMKQRTEKVLGSLEKGMKQGGLELSALKDVTNGVMGMNDEVVDYIEACDQDVWANEEMKDLVSDYFRNSLEALDFCGVLERSVQQARDNQIFIETALSLLPDDANPTDEACKQILQELDHFAHADNPFAAEFSKLFLEVYDRQRKLQERLTEKRRKYQKKERNLRVMKKITTVILTASCVSLVVCAAVAMAVASPVLDSTVAEAASLPFEFMHSWLHRLWAHYEQRIRSERGVADAAHWGTWVAIKDLDTINTEVRRLRNEIEGIHRNIEFARDRGDSLAVQNSIRMIRKKHEQFVKQLDDLASHVNECIKRVTTARSRVLVKILSQSSRA
ncbi:hypothetical protein MPTK1_1g08020 [Marchantia polymorpha subsp. ruderalis]|nr:hypothetical protein MARPO_0036s0046 [Marchantia polymorpha]BBM97750.1 hypothetical protein Mp_1g08020 [Marchantia polymorpha subsp. ruderalis]|eukprot:PTQ41052.1 hypothetical protein MARPO_0036s0046 [Marchantia polymorpha]